MDSIDKDIFIQRGEKFVRLPLNKVVYFTSTEDGCEAIMISRKRTPINVSLNNIARYLPDLFHRIHESCIINEKKIDCFTETHMWLSGGYKLPMTKNGFKNLTKGRLVCKGSLEKERINDIDNNAKNDLGTSPNTFSEN